MEPTSVTSTQSTTPAPQPNSTSDTINSDFDTFLRMLTAQIENQDPLNPIESSDFAVQLATFSGVEQQVQTNELLESLVGSMALGGVAEIAGWVGLDGRAEVPARFDGAPIELFPKIPLEADQATLIVRDPSGGEVQRRAIDPASASLTWAGDDNAGATVTEGFYSFEIEAFQAGEPIGVSVPETWGRIAEVRDEATGPVAVFADGTQTAASDVTGLRAEASPV